MNKMIVSTSPERHNTVRLHKDEPYFLKNIALIFYKKNLDDIEQDYYKFIAKMQSLSEEEKNKIHKSLLKAKKEEIYISNQQRYSSTLPEHFAKFLGYLTLFEKESKQQQEYAEKNKEKLTLQQIMEDDKAKRDAMKKAEKEERQQSGKLTAKEKREAYQIKKDAEKNATIAIEDAK